MLVSRGLFWFACGDAIDVVTCDEFYFYFECSSSRETGFSDVEKRDIQSADDSQRFPDLPVAFSPERVAF